MAGLDVSVVVPVYNEEDSIPEMYRQLTEALSQLDRTYEILVIDDGSADGSYELLKELHEKDTHVRVIRFRRNFGQTAAFSAGFAHARGDVIITIDADLQNDPADIPKLLAKIDEGYDVVSGWRIDRKDPFISRRLPSILANRLISETTSVRLHDYGCSLKAYRSEVAKNVNLYGEMHRFIPAIASWMGTRTAEIPVNHRSRQFGKSKYGISRTIRVFLDMLTVRFMLSYSTRPLHVFGLIGLVTSGAGFLIGLYLAVVKIIFAQDIGSRPLLMLAVLLIVIGVQMITMGLLGEMVARTYHEAQDKRIYVIREILEE
jgi:glycosyltransferase involved in cell wall biosynthesis